MAESSTTPADPARELAMYVARKLPQDSGPILVAGAIVGALQGAGLLSLPDTEGVASLRASGTPVPSAEVIAAEIEAHAAQAIPRDDLALIRDLASGLSLKEIAAKGAGTRSAVHMHAGRMRQRLGVASNCQAVYEATLRGLLKGVPRP